MTAILALIASPIARWLIAGGVILAALGGLYTKGRIDGHNSYKSKVERQINDAISKGEQGRADALRKLDADGVPPGWYRD